MITAFKMLIYIGCTLYITVSDHALKVLVQYRFIVTDYRIQSVSVYGLYTMTPYECIAGSECS